MIPDDPGQFRTDAENLVIQTCCFDLGKNNQTFNIYFRRHLNADKRNNNFYFKVNCERNKKNNKTFNAKFELKKLKSDDNQMLEENLAAVKPDRITGRSI